MKRIVSIDIIKGIGTILVVLGHIHFSFEQINFIYLFHMPLFFYLSGIFHKEESNLRESLQKNKLLLGSYLTYGVIFIAINCLIRREVDSSLITNLLRATPGSIWGIQWFGIFWFVPCLFFVKTFSSVLKKWSILWGIVIYLTTFIICEYSSINLNLIPLCVGPGLFSLLFYQIGKAHPLIEKSYSHKNLILAFTAYTTIMIISCHYFNGYEEKIVNYNILKVFNPFLAITAALIGILTCSYCAIFIEKQSPLLKKTLVYIGKNSYPFFIWHSFIFFLLKKVNNATFLLDRDTFLYKSLLLLLSLCTCAAITEVQHRLLKNRWRSLRKLMTLKN